MALCPAIIERRKPIMVVEVKTRQEPVSSSLTYLKRRFPSADAWQVHLRGTADTVNQEGIRSWRASRFLGGLA
jgi:hypothetical protein